MQDVIIEPTDGTGCRLSLDDWDSSSPTSFLILSSSSGEAVTIDRGQAVVLARMLMEWADA